jgi:hypothetical protein
VPVDSSLIAAILSSAGAGTAIICILLITGILSTKNYTERVIRDAADWKAAYDDERKAHQATRDALVLANERTEAAVETAKLTRMLLEEARRGTGGARALET